ncbi:hypothetical protein niasHT_013599 [Heterodera trifolii]|uniref:Thyroglobulin type-1 domain-containing protein n=1 Tax=Heterodera trifolii TaxID=157864 RepID=A0ABD2LE80_9BILA
MAICFSFAFHLFSQNSTAEKCADGGAWERICRRDGDCPLRGEMCAEGKCCETCGQRRIRSLREANAAGADRRAMDEGIAQCDEDGKFYRPMQCAGDSSECYCVDKFGRKIGPKEGKWWRKTTEEGRKEETVTMNCTEMRRECEEGEGVTKGRRHKKSEERTTKGTQAEKGEEKPNGSRTDRTHEEEEGCADPLRVFRHCGSACPISCATQMAPRCPQEQCRRGCFCRLPYVVFDAANPFGSKCVLPSECPLLPFTSDLNLWNGGFFPAMASPQEEGKGRTEEKCADPLKNFQHCGSACPVGCGSARAGARGGECSAQCVSGCFCRVPFLLRDPLDPFSDCVFPRQCPPSPSPSSVLPLLSATVPSPIGCAPSEFKSWTSCFSRKCSPSCADFSLPLSSECVPDDCLPGCQCFSPAVVKDKSASVWQCILPKNCPKRDAQQQPNNQLLSCEDPRKEFLSCGSSCPLGCAHLSLPRRFCSPCVSGCFCRNGRFSLLFSALMHFMSPIDFYESN